MTPFQFVAIDTIITGVLCAIFYWIGRRHGKKRGAKYVMRYLKKKDQQRRMVQQMREDRINRAIDHHKLAANPKVFDPGPFLPQ